MFIFTCQLAHRERSVGGILPERAGSSITQDGPSAGIAMVCALVSLFTGLRVPVDTAMTGEVMQPQCVFTHG